MSTKTRAHLPPTRQLLAVAPLSTAPPAMDLPASASPTKPRRPFTEANPAAILVLTANASARATHLQLEQEMRTIDDALQCARFREHYTLRMCPAVTFARVIRALDDHEPDVLHIGSHGAPSGSLVLEAPDGGEHHIEPAHVAELLALLPTRPRLVTFAACHSTALARAAARYADHAIGFEGPLHDDTALLYSATLYERLASHPQPDVPRAFALARLACRALGCDDADRARLFGRPGVSLDAA